MTGDVMLGQCLACGGRGGWWTNGLRTPCSRCRGSGRDPARSEPWYSDIVLPEQHRARQEPT